jgi:rhodanese-related sulfurtransferase
MPRDIHDRLEVQALMDRGAQVIDVLSAEEFEEDHLPAAINLRLRDIDPESVRQLDLSRPVVVYCWDSA